MTCAYCKRTVWGSLCSTALRASFCGYPCYDAAWREHFAKPYPVGAIPSLEDMDSWDMEGTPDGAIEPEVIA